MRDEK
jgi:hypothetical protein